MSEVGSFEHSVVVSHKDLETMEQYAKSMKEQRDTLIKALRECVVALEHCSFFDEWMLDRCDKCKQCEQALKDGRSTLERYGEK